MKYILTILFFLTAYFVNAQYIPNSAAYQWKGGEFLKSLQIPTACGSPTTSIHAPDSNRAALYYDSCNDIVYKFNPATKAWAPISVGSQFIKDGLIQPGYVTWSGTGLTFNVTSAIYAINGTIYTSPAGQITLDPSDPSLPRYDVIAVDTNSAIIKITGTPATNPVIPQVDPGSQVLLTYIFLAAGAVTPTQIRQTIIYDENTEPYTHTITAGLTVNFDNTTTVFHGAKSADISSATTTKNIDFTKGSGLDTASNYSMITIYVKLKDTFATNGNLRVQFFNGTSAVSNAIIFAASNGFNKKNKTTYQNIIVPISAFTFPGSTVFNKVRLTLTGRTNGLYADYFQLQSGLPPNPSVETDPIATQKTITVNGNTQVLNNNPVFTVGGIDSIFITNTDSIFIISGNDTIFIGNANNAVDTIYQRVDSIFGVKAGIEFLAALTGAAAPSGGMDTAYTRNDSIFGKKNNAEFLISNVDQLIDSIFITNTDSIFIITGNDTIFIGTAGNGGASMQSAYDSSLRAGDNPTINAHGNALTIDSLSSFLSTAGHGLFTITDEQGGIAIVNDTANVTFNTTLDATTMKATIQAASPSGTHEIDVSPRKILLTGSDDLTNNKLKVQFDNLDSSDADANNIAWFDANNILHRGHVSGSGGGSSSIILDSVIVDFDGLHPTISVPISASSAKNIDISPESEAAGGFRFGWNASEAVLRYQTAIKGTYKFYITYYQ